MNGKRTIFAFLIIIMVSLLVLHTNQMKVDANEYQNTPISNTLKGTHFTGLLKEVSVNEELYLLVSTDEAIYLTKNLEVEVAIPHRYSALILDVAVVGDMNENGTEDLLVITKKEVVLYDSSDYTMIWKFIPQMNAYSSNLGYYMHNVAIEDYLLNNSSLIFVAGYKLFDIDLSTGNVNWEYKADDNLWNVIKVNDRKKSSGSNYLVAEQGGDVISVSESGKLMWQKAVSEEVKLSHQEDVVLKSDTSIWNFAYEENKKYVYAISENGKIYTLDLLSGSILYTYDEYELSEDYLQSNWNKIGKGSKNNDLYRARDIEFVEDYDGDGKSDLIYFFDINNYRDSSKSKIILLGTKGNTSGDFNKIWSHAIPASVYHFSDDLTYDGEQVLFKYKSSEQTGASDTLHTKHYYGFWSYKTGEFTETQFDFTDFHEFKQASLRKPVFKMHKQQDGIYTVMASNRLTNIKLNEDQTEIIKQRSVVTETEVKVDEDYRLQVESYGGEGYNVENYTRFSLYIHSSSEPIWKFSTFDQRPIRYDYTTDVNKDGFKELVLLYNKGSILKNDTGEIQGNPFNYEVIDGKTGARMGHKEIILPIDETVLTYDDYQYEKLIESYLKAQVMVFEISHDITDDGINDLFITLSNGDILYYDLTIDGNQLLDFYTSRYELFIEAESLDEMSQEDLVNFEHPHYIPGNILSSDMRLLVSGDSNADGCQDYLIYSPNDSEIKKLETIKRDNQCRINPTYVEFETELKVPERFMYTYDDINGNQRKELIIKPNPYNYRGPDLFLYIVDTETGELIKKNVIDKTKNYSHAIVFLIDDVNNNQYKELVTITMSEHTGKTEIQITDLKSDLMLLSKSYGIMYNIALLDVPYQPVVTIPDTNGNNLPELVITLSNYHGDYTQGMNKFEFYETGADGDLTLIKNESFMFPSISEQQIEDKDQFRPEQYVDFLEMNNQTFLYGIIKNKHTYFYNLTESRLEMISHEKRLHSKVNIHNRLFFMSGSVMYGSGRYDLNQVNLQHDLSIKGLEDGATINKQVELEFMNKNDGEIFIYVNDHLVGKTTKDTYTLDLLEGDYTIKVSQVDETWGEHFYSVNVTVTKNYAYLIFTPAVTVVLLASVLILPRKQTKYKNPFLKTERSDQDE